MRSDLYRDVDPNPVIFGPPDPDPVLFSADPDPTCNNGFIKLFLSWTKYKSESTNSSIKWWVIISNFIPTYLKYKYIFFFISISGRIRSRIRIRNFFSAEPDPDPRKKFRILIPGCNHACFTVLSLDQQDPLRLRYIQLPERGCDVFRVQNGGERIRDEREHGEPLPARHARLGQPGTVVHFNDVTLVFPHLLLKMSMSW